MKSIFKKLLGCIAILLSALIIACAAYISSYYHADDTARAALASQDGYTVETMGQFTVFSPTLPDTGFIFYPGGKVEYTAYAPLMAALAQENILCVLVEMPGNLAVLDADAAHEIPGLFPEIDCWYIGGHSLGGSMAASYAADNADRLSGLVLLAAYATEDLTNSGLEVISIYGSLDTVLNHQKYEKYRSNLPETTTEIILQGGNHCGFGNYGFQSGDTPATISAEQQLFLTAQHLLSFFCP